MKKATTNVRFAVKNNQKDRKKFDIYLDFSGQQEYLTTHRYNRPLYNLLKEGTRVDALRRWKVAKSKAHDSRKESLDGSVKHLLSVVDDYIRQRSLPLTVYQFESGIMEIEEKAAA